MKYIFVIINKLGDIDVAKVFYKSNKIFKSLT
jgi:hypothetical protein